MNNDMQNNLEGNYANYADRWMSALHVVGFQKKFSHGISSSAGVVVLVFSGSFGERVFYGNVR